MDSVCHIIMKFQGWKRKTKVYIYAEFKTLLLLFFCFKCRAYKICQKLKMERWRRAQIIKHMIAWLKDYFLKSFKFLHMLFTGLSRAKNVQHKVQFEEANWKNWGLTQSGSRSSSLPGMHGNNREPFSVKDSQENAFLAFPALSYFVGESKRKKENYTRLPSVLSLDQAPFFYRL